MILLCILFVQVFRASEVYENRSDVVVFKVFSDESILNSLKTVYLGDV